MRPFLAFFFAVFITTPAMALDWPKGHTRTLILENTCNKTLKVIVTYSPTKDVWEKAGWFEINPGVRTFVHSKGQRIQHRDTATLLLFARALDRSFQLQGDHGTNFDGEHVKSFKATRLFRGKFVEARLVCD